MAFHFVKVVVLLGLGLGGLYMIHLLAQDFNRIRRPVAVATRALTGASSALIQWQQRQARGKRHVSTPYYSHVQSIRHKLTPRPVVEDVDEGTEASVPKIDWKRILARDPFECLPSLICQLMAGVDSMSAEALMLLDYLETSLSVAPAKVARAFSRGLALQGSPERCYDEYPFCVYSAKTMLRVLEWFSGSNNNSP